MLDPFLGSPTGEISAVTVGAVGNDRPVDVTVFGKLDGAPKPESKAVSVPAGVPRSLAKPAGNPKPADHHDCGCGGSDPHQCACDDKKAITPSANGKPDFARMTTAEKLAYNKANRDRIFG